MQPCESIHLSGSPLMIRLPPEIQDILRPVGARREILLVISKPSMVAVRKASPSSKPGVAKEKLPFSSGVAVCSGIPGPTSFKVTGFSLLAVPAILV